MVGRLPASSDASHLAGARQNSELFGGSCDLGGEPQWYDDKGFASIGADDSGDRAASRIIHGSDCGDPAGGSRTLDHHGGVDFLASRI
jgi:hypothetical protein